MTNKLLEIVDLEKRPSSQTEVAGPTGTRLMHKGVRQMLLYEALARARMREAEEAAARYRVARRLVAGRRWARLAKYATARAERARRAV
ncbi:hypothetical protein GCM10023321_38540 [Pseudonocardia eucalypti]|uniref:Uncharacterized protein n=1 Tax=Pseudonocardia eucalypti TaxID=648755 RepID=A0ABP9QB08_9PSEU|nr:hypothetical protein [Pseudonocardia eucalypti]